MMKLLRILLLTLACSSCANDRLLPKTDNSFVLSNINIVDVVNHQIIPDQHVVVEGGRIAAILNSNQHINNSSFTVIDGKGGFITPGLIDMHVHMYEKAAYVLSLSHGVTHVRIMNGVPKQLAWRDKILAGKQLGSTSTVSSPIISGYLDAHLHHGVETEEQAVAAVQLYKEQGYDLIKAYGNLNSESLAAIASEGKKLDIAIAKHGPHGTGDITVSDLTHFQSFEHAEDIFQGPLNHQFATEQLPAIIKKLKATGVPVTPTLNIYYQLAMLSLDKQDFLDTIPTHYTSDIIAMEAASNQVERWLNASENMAAYNQKTLKFLLYITQMLHKQGVPLLVGSDSGVLLSPHGLATHNEMDLLQQAGLNSYEVLAAATVNAAKALKLDKEIGSIDSNYQADFVYTASNPIEQLSVLKQPDAVIKKGVWYSKAELKALRDKAIEQRSLWDELWVLAEAL